MKATMDENVSNAVNYKGQKELVKSYNVITDTLREIIIAHALGFSNVLIVEN